MKITLTQDLILIEKIVNPDEFNMNNAGIIKDVGPHLKPTSFVGRKIVYLANSAKALNTRGDDHRALISSKDILFFYEDE